jgi:cytochrome c biogenesis protein CcdA
MADLIIVLIPIFLLDVLAPGLLALVILLSATDRPVANPLSLLVGHTVTYFLGGVLLAQGVEQLTDALLHQWMQPRNLDFAIGVVIGLVCLAWALKPGKEPVKSPQMSEPDPKPAKCFVFGAVLRTVSLPLALPYFAAISEILKADLTTSESLIVLTTYNLAYVFPYALTLLLIVVLGDRVRPWLARANDKILSFGTAIVPWLVAALGVWLIFDAAYFWTVGEAVF